MSPIDLITNKRASRAVHLKQGPTTNATAIIQPEAAYRDVPGPYLQELQREAESLDESGIRAQVTSLWAEDWLSPEDEVYG